MLQIANKVYFRHGVPLNSTVHRTVLYTNRSFLRDYPDYGPISLPVGELAPSTGTAPISTVTVSITDHMEAVRPDGQQEILIATDGQDLVDDLAFVLSFALNATFSRDHDLVHRLVPDQLDNRRRSAPSNLFRGTFDPRIVVKEDELDDVRALMSQLLALQRPHFEAAMKAIRRVVRARQRVVEDPTTAYTDLVAALESLAKDEPVPAPSWSQLDGAKRKLIDAALEGAEPERSGRVRNAVMAAEHLGLKSRFTQFVLNRVSPAYFRHEAADALRPIRRPDLERAVKLAYDIRSRNVHTLWDMPPEAWVLNDRADTVSHSDLGTMLSLEGLARLARHVIRAYINGAPTGVDTSFDWRANLPGIVRIQLAPQYWIHNDAGFDHKSAANYFRGFIENIVETLAKREKSAADMRKVLARIEALVPGTAGSDPKTIMVAIYALWHQFLDQTHHRPGAEAFLGRHRHVLEAPSMTAFVVSLLLNQIPDWSTEQWESLATQRAADRQRRGAQPIPAAFDAALQAFVAEKVWTDRRVDEAAAYAARAVEELPGNQQLLCWESRFVPATDSPGSGATESDSDTGRTDEPAEVLDLLSLVLGISTQAEQSSPEDAQAEQSSPEDAQAEQSSPEDAQAEQSSPEDAQAEQSSPEDSAGRETAPDSPAAPVAGDPSDGASASA
ncbi:hypothetical protein GCM10010123_19930 [Pilimelia anulata]|uniref:Uncharacterized protein n=1 Tax=Pilimelia anulata TaxID=53371 RepID=A0A8J3B216_9ACTN|nr:hypothetical protein [Pilimelia anulata]GGJ90101.1 hypothetical protein GCM10010123_19930 [Pilimelia anulata]